MLILGKGGDFEHGGFFSMPQIPSFKPQKGVPAERRQVTRRATLSPKYPGNGYKVKRGGVIVVSMRVGYQVTM